MLLDLMFVRIITSLLLLLKTYNPSLNVKILEVREYKEYGIDLLPALIISVNDMPVKIIEGLKSLLEKIDEVKSVILDP